MCRTIGTARRRDAAGRYPELRKPLPAIVLEPKVSHHPSSYQVGFRRGAIAAGFLGILDALQNEIIWMDGSSRELYFSGDVTAFKLPMNRMIWGHLYSLMLLSNERLTEMA